MAVLVGAVNPRSPRPSRRRPRGELAQTLAAVVEAWPEISEAIVAGIIAMLEASTGNG